MARRLVQSGSLIPAAIIDPVSGRPIAMTEDGEIWTTVTERENDVFSQYSEAAIDTTKYVIMVDKDNANFPHCLQNQGMNRIDITIVFLVVDAAINSNGILNLGVISRIDGTNADILYLLGIPFLATTTQFIASFRGTPSQAKMDILDGVLQHGVTNNKETNVAAVNTSVALDSPLGAGTVFPALGDIVLKIQHVSGGAYNAGVFIFYHGHN
jgi:hypothetical protein